MGLRRFFRRAKKRFTKVGKGIAKIAKTVAKPITTAVKSLEKIATAPIKFLEDKVPGFKEIMSIAELALPANIVDAVDKVRMTVALVKDGKLPGLRDFASFIPQLDKGLKLIDKAKKLSKVAKGTYEGVRDKDFKKLANIAKDAAGDAILNRAGGSDGKLSKALNKAKEKIGAENMKKIGKAADLGKKIIKNKDKLKSLTTTEGIKSELTKQVKNEIAKKVNPNIQLDPREIQKRIEQEINSKTNKLSEKVKRQVVGKLKDLPMNNVGNSVSLDAALRKELSRQIDLSLKPKVQGKFFNIARLQSRGDLGVATPPQRTRGAAAQKKAAQRSGRASR